MPSSPHAYMTNYLEEIKETLIKPDKITNSIYDDFKVNYYKERKHFFKVKGISRYLS